MRLTILSVMGDHQEAMRNAFIEYAAAVLDLVPQRSRRLVLTTLSGYTQHRIQWSMLQSFLRTFVDDKQALRALIARLATKLHDITAQRIAARELASHPVDACLVCLSFRATDPCDKCKRGKIVCSGCEGVCMVCAESQP